ncbi:MAG: putative immunity protein [Planctomycetota bacterium]
MFNAPGVDMRDLNTETHLLLAENRYVISIGGGTSRPCEMGVSLERVADPFIPVFDFSPYLTNEEGHTELMTIRLEVALRSMFEFDSTSVVADYLDGVSDFDAQVIRCMSDPIEVVRYLASELDAPEIILDLPFDRVDRLNMSLLHTSVDDQTLFSLACEFAEHVLRVYEEWNDSDARPREVLECMRDWLAGSSSDASLRKCRHRLFSRPASYAIARIPAAPQAALEAIRHATNPWAWARHCAAPFAAHNSSMNARRAAADDETELSWQIDCVRTALRSSFE